MYAVGWAPTVFNNSLIRRANVFFFHRLIVRVQIRLLGRKIVDSVGDGEALAPARGYATIAKSGP